MTDLKSASFANRNKKANELLGKNDIYAGCFPPQFQ